MLLVLFDIDGTLLLNASREHAAALHAALHRVHGVSGPPAGSVEAAGRTDGAIARSILLLAGVPADRIDARAVAVRVAACEEFAQHCPADLSAHLAPGMPAVLEALAARDDVRLALVTGNFEPVARLKLQRAGIGRYFPAGQGGFGSDSEDRAVLPTIARRRAGAAGHPWPREDTLVIGDTPRDIACARADGVSVIAIPTGPFGAEALRDADVVVTRPSELPDAIERVAQGSVQKPS